MLGLNLRRVFCCCFWKVSETSAWRLFQWEHVCQQFSFLDAFSFIFRVQITLKNRKYLGLSEEVMSRIRFPFALLLIFFSLALFSWEYAEKIRRIYTDFVLPRKITGLTVAFTQLWNCTLFISQWDKVTLQLGTPVKPHLPFLSLKKKKVLRNLYFCNYFSRPSPLGHLVQEVAQFPQLLNKMHHRLRGSVHLHTVVSFSLTRRRPHVSSLGSLRGTCLQPCHGDSWVNSFLPLWTPASSLPSLPNYILSSLLLKAGWYGWHQ